MVQLNNTFDNYDRVLGEYLRGLHEFRVGIELSLLPLVAYLQQYDGKDHKHLGKEIEYVDMLSKIYHKISVKLKVPDNKEFIYIRRIIYQAKKTVSYSYNDINDLLSSKLVDIKVPSNISYIAFRSTKHYFKEVPSEVSESYDESVVMLKKYAHESLGSSLMKKYSTPIILYFDILSNMKKAIDFAAMKMYDYLYENPKLVKCYAFIDVQDEMMEVCTQEYGKIPLKIQYEYAKPQTERDIIFEEWASNIRRAFNLKAQITSYLIKYLSSMEREQMITYKYNPEVSMLVKLFFKKIGMEVPKEFL
ncbi:MAG TPA: hypothetical protein VEC16_02415 [Alphaproteobacteria bacterium]|nr:hypothetical protein [Alphaproteobacteria bacterium]